MTVCDCVLINVLTSRCAPPPIGERGRELLLNPQTNFADGRRAFAHLAYDVRFRKDDGWVVPLGEGQGHVSSARLFQVCRWPPVAWREAPDAPQRSIHRREQVIAFPPSWSRFRDPLTLFPTYGKRELIKRRGVELVVRKRCHRTSPSCVAWKDHSIEPAAGIETGVEEKKVVRSLK